MKTNKILQPKRILSGLSAVAILATASCTYTERQVSETYADPSRTVAVAQEDYVYYPSHNVYYNRGADNFRTYEGNRWVTQTAPRNVTRQQVLASESVSIAKYGTPERHYTEYVQPNLTSGSRSLERASNTSANVNTTPANNVRTTNSRTSTARTVQY